MKIRSLFLLSAGSSPALVRLARALRSVSVPRVLTLRSRRQITTRWSSKTNSSDIRVTFGPHAKMAMHQHPDPGGVIVTVTDQDALITAPDGTSREVHYKTGLFRWAASAPGAALSSQSAHLEENLSDKPFEMIRIEPKRAR